MALAGGPEGMGLARPAEASGEFARQMDVVLAARAQVPYAETETAFDPRTITFRLVSNGWLLETSEGVEAVATAVPEVLQAVECWAKQGSADRRRFARSARPPPEFRVLASARCVLVVRTVRNGFIISTGSGEEYAAMDVGQLVCIVGKWAEKCAPKVAANAR